MEENQDKTQQEAVNQIYNYAANLMAILNQYLYQTST